MNQTLALMEAGKAAERALKIVEQAMKDGEGEMTVGRAAQLVTESRRLQCAALEVERNAQGVPPPKRG